MGGWIECKLVEAWGNKPIGIPTGIPFILAFRIRIHTINRGRFIVLRQVPIFRISS